MNSDLVHLTGVIKTHPVLDRLDDPDGTHTVRLVNTLIGADNERHTIVFTGDQAHAARHALSARVRLRITGRVVGPRRIEVLYFALDGRPAEQHPPRHRPGRLDPPEPVDRQHERRARNEASQDRPAEQADRQESQSNPAEAAPLPVGVDDTAGAQPRRESSQIHRRRVDRTGCLRL